jgi:hypothetical protein
MAASPNITPKQPLMSRTTPANVAQPVGGASVEGPEAAEVSGVEEEGVVLMAIAVTFLTARVAGPHPLGVIRANPVELVAAVLHHGRRQADQPRPPTEGGPGT